MELEFLHHRRDSGTRFDSHLIESAVDVVGDRLRRHVRLRGDVADGAPSGLSWAQISGGHPTTLS